MTQPTLHKTLQQYHPAMIETCSRLLQTPSVNGVHDEIHLAKVIADIAKSLDLHVEITGENPKRPNVIVSTHEDGATGLLLLGHLDTVPPGDENLWTHPPFSGAIAENKIWGRGAVDTKSGMTSALYALTALKEQNALHNGRAQLICVPDEETGATGTLGIRYLDCTGKLGGLGAIYAYSGDEIMLGHRGLLRYKLICEGEPVHTGFEAWQAGTTGANAVTGMARLLLALENLDTPYSTTPYFESFKTVVTPGTVISGGVNINIVPAYCEALVDIRLTPEFNREILDTYLNKFIQQITNTNPKLRFRHEILNNVPAALSDDTATIFSVLEDVIEEVKGIRPKRGVAGPANEGYLLIERGIPCVCGLGPAGENAHAIDEYVEVKSLLDAAQIFALTAIELDKTLGAG